MERGCKSTQNVDLVGKHKSKSVRTLLVLSSLCAALNHASLLLVCIGCKSSSGPGQPGGLAGVCGAFYEGICSRW